MAGNEQRWGRLELGPWQKGMAPRSGVGSSVENHWGREPGRRQQPDKEEETTDREGVLRRLGHQLFLGLWASHSTPLGLSFRFCKMTGLDAASPTAMPLGPGALRHWECQRNCQGGREWWAPRSQLASRQVEWQC